MTNQILSYLSVESFQSHPQVINNQDYSSLLKLLGAEITSEDDYYLYINKPTKVQGWILHISVIPLQIEKLLKEILPIMSKYNLPFKIIKNRKLHKHSNSGVYGNFKIGKIITVFLENEIIIEQFIRELIPLTAEFTGPRVFTDFQIGAILYTRYGSFESTILTDSLGNRMRVITDGAGNMIQDQYYEPPIIPEGISNPFISCIDALPKPQKSLLIGNKYMPLKSLKSDVKGNVWKVLFFNKYFLPMFCVVKQGRKGMFPDEFGRDLRDRIKWQYTSNKKLKKTILIPEIFEHFEDDGQAYIAMKYIKGKNLKRVIQKKSNGVAWFYLEQAIQLEVLDLLLQVVQSISSLHLQKFVHRDITGANFMVSKYNTVHLLDVELLYSLSENHPDPPFGLGTPGYMSPEQELMETLPAFTDDSYSIGALMVMAFAGGIDPHYIIEYNRANLAQKLFFWIGDNKIVNLVVRCLSLNPEERPEISFILKELGTYRVSLPSSSKITVTQAKYSAEEIGEIIEKAIITLSSDLLTYNGLWFSRIENNYGRDVYPMGNKHFFLSLQRGVGGVIWLLSRIKGTQYDISSLENNVNLNMKYVENEVFNNIENLHPSLYFGKAGIALMLREAIQSGFLKDSSTYQDLILRCFLKAADSFNILYGAAGQGLGLMQCNGYLQQTDITNILDQYSLILINSQQKDGSWIRDIPSTNTKEKMTGFGYGIAGIVYFLLEYGFSYENNEAILSGINGLSYLSKRVIKKKGHYEWENSDRDKGRGKWWCKGAPGIALTFLKAYELTKEKGYLKTAENALHIHPKFLIHSNLSNCHGLTGLGEIYLEAYRITGQPEWKERAEWIVHTLINFRKEFISNTASWIVDQCEFSTADFMIGTSGIIHFLVRFTTCDKLSFPFLPSVIKH